ETVDAATKDIPAATATEAQEAKEASRELSPPKADRSTDGPGTLALPAADPWTGLLQAGMALAQQLTQASSGGARTNGLVRRDERTGETYLRLPVPSPEVVQQALQVVGALLQSIQPKR